MENLATPPDIIAVGLKVFHQRDSVAQFVEFTPLILLLCIAVVTTRTRQ